MTQQTKKMEGLKESVNRLQQLVENIKEVLWVCSPDWNTIYYINPAYEFIWGRSCLTMYENAKSWLEAICEEDRESVYSAIDEKIRYNLTSPDFPEFRIVQPGGYMLWISAKAYPIKDEHGTLVGVAGIAEDITAWKQVETALRDNETRYRLLIEHVHDIIWRMDSTLQFTFVSPAVTKILGYSVEEVIGTSIADYLDEHSLSTMKHTISLKLSESTQYPKAKEYRMLHKKGHFVDVEVISSRLFDNDGRIMGFTGITRDISDRKKIEAALIASEKKFGYLFDNMLIGVALYRPADDGDNFIIEDINPAGLKLSRIENKKKSSIAK